MVSGERDSLMTDLTSELNKITMAEFGIELVDVRVKRIDLPSQVSQSVFDRMKSEREREAREQRGDGLPRDLFRHIFWALPSSAATAA